MSRSEDALAWSEPHEHSELGRVDALREASGQTAAAIMETSPVTVQGATVLGEVALRLGRAGADVAIVTDRDTRPVGLISAVEILRLGDRQQSGGGLRAIHAASLGAFVARLETPLDRLLHLVVELGAMHIVVVAGDGRVRGLIHATDALCAALPKAGAGNRS